MNNKIIIAIICILVIVGGTICYFAFKGNDNINENNKITSNVQEENSDTIENTDIKDTNIQKQEDNTNVSDTSSNSKVSVIYFSATGNTKNVAQYIKNETNGDIIEIVPAEKYTSEDLSYNNDCRANKEQQDKNARPKIANNVDITSYDTIFLGYPIWWGDVPKIILTFIDNNNLNGKKVIPFCTSGSTGIEQSQNTLKEYNKNMNVLEGKRFSSSASQEEKSSWIKGLDF